MSVVLDINYYSDHYIRSDSKAYHWYYTNCQDKAMKFPSEDEAISIVNKLLGFSWFTKEKFPEHKFIPVPD